MKKNYALIAKCLAAVVVIGGVYVNSDAISLVSEKAIAGISVSLDKASEKHAQEASESARVHAEDKGYDTVSASVQTSDDASESTSEEAYNEDTSISTSIASGAAADENEGADPEADDTDGVETYEEYAEDGELSKDGIKLDLRFDRLGMSKVQTYLNVRKKPSQNSEIVGKMTKNNACNIYKIKKGWAKIKSGNVIGYVKADYLYTDEEAEKKAKENADLRINVTTTTLNVRFLPTTESRIYDLISEDSDYRVVKNNITKDWLDRLVQKMVDRKDLKKKDVKNADWDAIYNDLDNWICIKIDNGKAFVNRDYVKLSYNVDRAVPFTVKQTGESGGSGSSASGSSGGVGGGIVNYAMQFLGNPYVWGGSSLTHGTDCSGFTMSLYAAYGKYLPHSSSAQAGCTTSVSSPQPGDLFFYGSGGHVSHVAMYIGGGQVIHASNHIDGIKISNAYYRSPIKIGRVG
ncbi:MAG: SH3 domain-containing C40 family peptidase [Lachnospiraceae bacterium]|jgi:cell wall-associated NlpC family hydrolase|nr:SH3 domain-containing C40 family peptidase [Lachnospiraceae bacterium]MEE3461397.1 SH3 domain-containing C40 family peptidase [Lachnospiraceae bacterium]